MSFFPSPHPFSDGKESEIVGLQFLWCHPKAFGSIVARCQATDVVHLAGEKQVECGNRQPRIEICVGDGEEIAGGDDVKSRLFCHLARHSLLRRLADVGKPARQVEGPLGRFSVAALHEQATL